MPRAEEKRRGGVKRYRTIKPTKGTYIHVGVVPKAGPKGGHTVAGPVHHKKKVKRAAKGIVVDPAGVGPRQAAATARPPGPPQEIRTTRETVLGRGR